MLGAFTRRKVLTAALAATSVVALDGCSLFSHDEGGGGDKKLRFMWWGNPERNKLTLSALKARQQADPGVRLVGTSVPWDGYWTKLASQVASKTAADVVQMSVDYLAEYAARGSLVDFRKYSPKAINLDAFDPVSLKRSDLDGKLYALPFGLGAQTLLYDAGLLDKLGITPPSIDSTWTDYADLTGRITKAVRGGKLGKTRFGTQDASGAFYHFEVFIRQLGKELYTPDRKALGFGKEDLTQWFTIWEEMRRTGAASSAQATQAIAAEGAEATGTVAFQFANSNQLASYQATTQHRLAMAPVPNVADASRPGRYIDASMYLSAIASSKYPEESVGLVADLLTNAKIARHLGLERGVPPDEKVAQALKGKASDIERMQLDYVEVVRKHASAAPPLAPKGAGDLDLGLQRQAQSIAFGRASIRAGVDQYFRDAERILA